MMCTRSVWCVVCDVRCAAWCVVCCVGALSPTEFVSSQSIRKKERMRKKVENRKYQFRGNQNKLAGGALKCVPSLWRNNQNRAGCYVPEV